MKRLQQGILGAFMVAVVLSMPHKVLAQVQIQPDPAQPQATTQDERGLGVNWWWLLPLLAVPFLFLLLPRRDEDEEAHYDDVVGAKGGEVKRDRDTDDVDF